MSAPKASTGIPSRTNLLRMNAANPLRWYAATMKYPEIMKNRLMKKDLFTVKKGASTAARVALWTGQ